MRTCHERMVFHIDLTRTPHIYNGRFKLALTSLSSALRSLSNAVLCRNNPGYNILSAIARKCTNRFQPGRDTDRSRSGSRRGESFQGLGWGNGFRSNSRASRATALVWASRFFWISRRNARCYTICIVWHASEAQDKENGWKVIREKIGR